MWSENPFMPRKIRFAKSLDKIVLRAKPAWLEVSERSPEVDDS